MSSEDIMKLFEEVASVYQNEGSEALTEKRISELCKKHDISATKLENLYKDVSCIGEEKISIYDDILENVAGGKMDLKRGAATLLAALSAAGPLSPNALASEPKNVRQKITNNAEADHVSKKAPDMVSRAQNNRFGISNKTAKWMVGAAALLSAYPIFKGVKGLISNELSELSELSGSFNSNKFKDWLKKGGAIRLDDSKCNSVEELKSRLRTCGKGKYKAEQYRNMFLVCPYDEDEKCKMFCACIGSSPSDTLQLASFLGFQCVCRGGNLTGSECFINGNLRQLLTIAQTPVIVVNRKVIDEIIIDQHKYTDNKIKYFGDLCCGRDSWTFNCASDILKAFNSNGRLPVSDINSQHGTQNSELPSILQNGSDPLSGGLDSNEFKIWLKGYGAIRLDDNECNSLKELENRLRTCKKGEYKAVQYHSMLLVSQDETNGRSFSFRRVCIGDNKTSIEELNTILKRDLSCVASCYDERDFMQDDEICDLLNEGTVPVIVVNENVMDEIVLDPGRNIKFKGDDGEGIFDCATDILKAFNAKR